MIEVQVYPDDPSVILLNRVNDKDFGRVYWYCIQLLRCMEEELSGNNYYDHYRETLTSVILSGETGLLLMTLRRMRAWIKNSTMDPSQDVRVAVRVAYNECAMKLGDEKHIDLSL